MKKNLFGMAVFAVSMGCLLSLASCSKKEEAAPVASEPKTLLESIKAKGEMVVGTASGYPPYEFVDIKAAGQPVIGIDMALAKAIADKIGVKLTISDMTFGALLSSIPANKIDVAIAGIAPTEERKKTVDFTDHYIDAEQRILIRKADAEKLSKLSDFYGKKIGAQKSTTQEALAKAEIKDAEVVALDKVPECILELLSGKIDGIVVESVVAQQYVLSNPTLTFSTAEFENRYKATACALAKGNEDFLKLMNDVIAEKKADGSFDKWILEYSQKAVDNAK